MTAEEFNEQFPIGSPVNYHPVIGRPVYEQRWTRSKAWTLPNDEPVVQLEGKSGCVAIEAISARDDESLCCRCQAKPGIHGHPQDEGNSNRWYCADCYCALMGF